MLKKNINERGGQFFQTVVSAVFGVVIALCGCFSDDLRADDVLYVTKIKPLLTKYCYDCHSGDDPEGKLSLEKYSSAAVALKDQATWKKIHAHLKSRKMPPKDETRPTEPEYKQILDWIDASLFNIDCQGDRDPGHVTLRRLNKVEYNNTVRDLVGIDFRPGDDFPNDDVGYGFDNIGDVLTTSPLLMEKYMAAAEKIVQRAIVANPLGPTTRYQAEKFKATSGRRPFLKMQILFGNAEMQQQHDFKEDGEYIIAVRVFGQQAGKDLPRMSIRVDGKELAALDVSATGDQPRVLRIRRKIKRGKRKLGIAFINDFYQEGTKDRKQQDRNLMVEYFEVVGPLNPKSKELPEAHQKIVFASPLTTGETSEQCARRVLRPFAVRAFRRNVHPRELDRLISLVKLAEDQGDSFERGIQLAIKTILVSPRFLFRVERDQFPRDSRRPHKITEFELATRLSYFLWSTMPDDELLRLAREGALRKNLAKQVERMLADSRSDSLVSNFAGQWLEIRKLESVAPDAKQFPEFDDALREAMQKETELFFAAVLRENRSVLDFLNGKYTFLNERLARHYGIQLAKSKETDGNKFRRVSLTGTNRGGVLTQGSILTLTSNPTRTSPVKRGKWILEQVLGTPPPPPPPNVDPLAEDKKAVESASLRQRMEIHRKNAVCASCHEQMDAIGFAFENFDAIGRFRTMDGKFAVEANGQLPSGEKFKNAQEFSAILSKSKHELFVKCLTEKLLTYATGRGIEYYDKCTVDEIFERMKKNDYRFVTLIHEVVKSDPFQKRRARGPAP